MRPIEKVLERFPNARKSGEGWSAPCPAHEDRNPSLSIAEGDDGRAIGPGNHANPHACAWRAIWLAFAYRAADGTCRKATGPMAALPAESNKRLEEPR